MAVDLCNFFNELKPAMVMVLVQIILSGLTVFFKLATRDGMNMLILVAYRYIFATFFLAPRAFFFERNKRPKLTWMVTFQAFFCGFFGGTLWQNLYVASLKLTSTTFAAAMINLIPKLGIQTLAGRMNLVGTTIGMEGAFVIQDTNPTLTFYKGAEVNIWSTNVDLRQGLGTEISTSASQGEFSNRILGSLMALGCSTSYAIWLIFQAKMSQRNPCYLSSSVFMCIMGSIQSVIFAVCIERNREEWKLAWGVRARGLMVVSFFNPLMLVLVAILCSLFLDEKLHIGIMLGGMLIVVGLYVVLWGKGEEMKRMSHLMLFKSFKEADHIEVVVTITTYSSFSPAITTTTDI
ncbi:hypothetical protein NE237_018337 [Protea cynaroides]|uniref:WAT1-related protein n=1 Tax=Protea cynaroides TaxID=273540 RepID=A0A9Q0K9N5_9MAGN|nr:hypothetical protein NE237_018337 [Protea cynaroides]